MVKKMIFEECECECNTFFIKIEEFKKPDCKRYTFICSKCKKEHDEITEYEN